VIRSIFVSVVVAFMVCPFVGVPCGVP